MEINDTCRANEHRSDKKIFKHTMLNATSREIVTLF